MYNNIKHMYKSRQIAKITKIVFAIGFIFFFFGRVYAAQDPALDDGDKAEKENKNKEKPSQMQSMSRSYRQQGVTAQKSGDIGLAMKYYQKSIELDPYYAAPYNDLGVIFEANGYIDRAEQSYMKAIELDPDYVSSYTNLALLNENKRDLNKAAFYWQKRAQLGAPEDPWTKKAARRAQDLNIVMSPTPIKDEREQEIIGMMNDISQKKSLMAQDNVVLAEDHFQKAKRYYAKGDLAGAFKEALDAQYLDPNNDKIDDFLTKVQERALSK